MIDNAKFPQQHGADAILAAIDKCRQRKIYPGTYHYIHKMLEAEGQEEADRQGQKTDWKETYEFVNRWKKGKDGE